MKLRAYCLALSLVASACLTSPGTETAQPMKRPTGSPIESSLPRVEVESDPGEPTAAEPIVQVRAFGLDHDGEYQFQVRSTIHESDSTTLEVFMAKGRWQRYWTPAFEFFLSIDGGIPVAGEGEIPWDSGNYETVWVKFQRATSPESVLILTVRDDDVEFVLPVRRTTPALPTQIDPLTGPIGLGSVYFGPLTVDVRSITFGESAIVAELLIINQNKDSARLWLDSRIVDDLGNIYKLWRPSSGKRVQIEGRRGLLVSAAFVGRIHPDATSLTVEVDHAVRPVTIGPLSLDMSPKLVPPLPVDAVFQGEANIRTAGITVSGGAVRFTQFYSEVDLSISNTSEMPREMTTRFDLMLLDNLGNVHRVMPPIRPDGELFVVDPSSKITGTFQFAGGIAGEADSLQLVLLNRGNNQRVLSEIQLERAGESTLPPPVLVRLVNRQVDVSFGESSSTTELLALVGGEVDEGVLLLELPDDVLFEFAQSAVSPEGVAILVDVADLLNRSAESSVSITGHTDGIGSVGANLALSFDRAEAVRDILVGRHGIDPARLTIEGLGESQPIADEFDESGQDSPDGRARNRRTEIRIDGFDG